MPINVPLIDERTILAFVLVLSRLSGLFLAAPVFSQSRIPAMIKASLVLMLTLVLMPLAGPVRGPDPDLGTLVLWLGREIMVGAIIGLGATFLLAAVGTAGQMVGFQMGLTYAGAVDPQFNTQMSPVAEMQSLMALMLFLLVEGHHQLLRALTLSFRLIPPGTFELTEGRLHHLVAASGGLFVIALQIAAPVFVLLLLTDVAMGLMTRFIPQMNIFVVGAPLKIGVGLAMLALTAPLVGGLLTTLFTNLDERLLRLVTGT